MIVTQVKLLAVDGVDVVKEEVFTTVGQPVDGEHKFQFSMDNKTFVQNFTVSLRSCSDKTGEETEIFSCRKCTCSRLILTC